MFLLGILLLVIFVWVAYFMMPAPAGLPILAYHKLSISGPDDVTVTATQLQEQLAVIERLGFTPLWFSDLKQILNGRQPLPNKPVVLTFDDHCDNVYSLAYPLLQRYHFKANLFLPTKCCDTGAESLIKAREKIDEMTQGLIKIGLILALPENDGPFSASQIDLELRQNLALMKQQELSFGQVIAFPQGATGASRRLRKAIKPVFEQHGVDFSLRTGSGTNNFPLSDVFQLRRITINGTDSLRRFKRKLKGRRVHTRKAGARSRSTPESKRTTRAAEMIH